MDALPSELLSQICSLACIDEGKTFISLRLVSTKFRAICIPMQYQTLSLSTHEDISRVAAKLSLMPSHLRKIYHLHIRFTLPSLAGMKELIQIAQLAAPTLETLTFTSTSLAASSSIIARLYRIPFPRLEELTLHGIYPIPGPNTWMPRLERLHLSGNRNPTGLLPQIESGRLPSLRYLRISGIVMAEGFCKELEGCLTRYRTAMGNAESPKRAYHAFPLQNLVIQPGREPTDKKDIAMMESLKRLVGLHERWLGKVTRDEDMFRVVLEERIQDSSLVCEALYRDWASRLKGFQ